MNRILITLFIVAMPMLKVAGQISKQSNNKSMTDTSRVERAKKKYQELFGPQTVENSSDPELMTILQRFIFGEVFFTGNLDDQTRELITITASDHESNITSIEGPHKRSIEHRGISHRDQGSCLSMRQLHWFSQGFKCP